MDYITRVFMQLFRISLYFCLSVLLSHHAAADDLSLQRQYYIKAVKAFEQNNTKLYQELKQKLVDYPLLAYLEFNELKQTLKTYPYQSVDAFLDKHGSSYIGQRLLRLWLQQLSYQQRWHDYRSYYEPTISSASYQCWYAWSRFKTGDKDALKGTATLWNVAKSQPDACDPLFEQWQKSGYLTDELVWSRYLKTTTKGKHGLGRYLKRFMSSETQSVASELDSIRQNPSLLINTQRFLSKQDKLGDAVYYGLKRYVKNNPDSAHALFKQYHSHYQFTTKQQQDFYYSLAKKYTRNDQFHYAEPLLAFLSNDQQTTIIDATLRELLKQQEWQAVSLWIGKLPKSEQESDRWLYWKARANSHINPHNIAMTESIFQNLALKRSFHGFLAADRLGQQYSLQDSPSIVLEETIGNIANIPAIQRARELFFLGYLSQARREWRVATQHFSTKQYQAVAQLTHQWGWYRKSIEAMAAAKAWDDLRIRFPIAHESIVQNKAQDIDIAETLIYAIARQESAWETDAVSHAGAMGLMQLLPSTAKDTARKAGIKHRKRDLLSPDHNIALGSRYINELLERYKGNRLLAVAAYNAGPRRVDRWLENTGNQLDFDIWIEAIPFRETRKYVQNVLSYSVVYAYRIGQKAPLITQVEAAKRL